jgi:hypothetical protein
MPLDDINEQVFQRLVEQHGWSRVDDLAQKAFPTAVGSKTATSRLVYDATFHLFRLQGEGYWSEGRDILSTCRAIIPASATPDTVNRAVDEFNARAQAAIEASYAARLFCAREAEHSTRGHPKP